MLWLQTPVPQASGPESKGLSSKPLAWYRAGDHGAGVTRSRTGRVAHDASARPSATGNGGRCGLGLRKLHVPDALPELLVRAEGLRRQLEPAPPPPQVGPQLMQIAQYFGEVNYREAEPFPAPIRAVVVVARLSRSSGRHLGTRHDVRRPARHDLAALFAARLATSPPPGDRPLVRRFAAISLGRMKAVNQLETCAVFAAQEGPSTEIGIGIRWALREITGEEQEPIPSPDLGISGWFLVPIDSETNCRWRRTVVDLCGGATSIAHSKSFSGQRILIHPPRCALCAL